MKLFKSLQPMYKTSFISFAFRMRKYRRRMRPFDYNPNGIYLDLQSYSQIYNFMVVQ